MPRLILALGLGADVMENEGGTRHRAFTAVSGKVHVHDLHATMLHLPGRDHLKLTSRHPGRDFRLTDVHGKVLQEILA